jgi:hypothetical protein
LFVQPLLIEGFLLEQARKWEEIPADGQFHCISLATWVVSVLFTELVVVVCSSGSKSVTSCDCLVIVVVVCSIEGV